MIVNIFKRITNYFKSNDSKLYEHDYDLENPKRVIMPIFSNREKRTRTIFKCKKCNKTLSLDIKDMKKLPFNMSHGCPIKTIKS